MSRDAWIGVDLDGTLAHYDGWRGPTYIGEPVGPMVRRVQEWIAQGRVVKVFTARVSGGDGRDMQQVRNAIAAWTKRHIGVELTATCIKDYAMIELWDDRCVRVIPNTGMPCCGQERK